MVQALSRDEVMSSWYHASLVERYHTWPTINKETVGQHSHGVAVLYLRHFVTNYSETQGAAVEWILYHDLSELHTGDAPFPAKVRFPTLGRGHAEAEKMANDDLRLARPTLLPDTLENIKACDLMQMYLFGMHEWRMGNKYAIPIARDMLSAATAIAARRSAAGDNRAMNMVKKLAEENHDE